MGSFSYKPAKVQGSEGPTETWEAWVQICQLAGGPWASYSLNLTGLLSAYIREEGNNPPPPRPSQ